jgi:putative nucleotidyltransferase with HDIG domain
MNRVLIVDDEKSIRLTLREMLRKNGYEAEMAEDVACALKMLDAQEFDIVMTDIVMPKVSGLELLKAIRERCRNVQILIMTGDPSVETASQALHHGANDYLIKPIVKEDLLKAVGHAAEIKALSDQKKRLELENQLYQKNLERIIEQKTLDLQNTMESIISLLSTVVEVRDPYTAGHQRRVGNLSAAMARKMGLKEDTIKMLRIIGYIHDIGKIEVPAEILSKPGKLSEVEFMLIKNHCTTGYNMLNEVNLPRIIGETIYQHHERCDGSGYPRGLKGDEISTEAHILMVADVVEAMMSHRPYRPALGLAAALGEISSGRGVRYRDDIVLACESLFLEDHYEIEDTVYHTTFPEI